MKFEPHLSDAQHNAEADSVMEISLTTENIVKTTEIIQSLHCKLLATLRVFCVSTKRDDILMWSHYADSHKGVCLEFDGRSPLMAHAQKVNYARKRVPINPYYDNTDRMFEMGMLTKSKHWAYETEWRLLRIEGGHGSAQFCPANLTGIILGASASQKTIDHVKNWESQRCGSLAIYQATTSDKNFELLISP